MVLWEQFRMPQPGVFGFVHHAHAAANSFEDAVVRDGLANHWRKMLRGRNQQVNESRGLGGGSRG
jgi:hypothetical protein